jgi:hypothetical protein
LGIILRIFISYLGDSILNRSGAENLISDKQVTTSNAPVSGEGEAVHGLRALGIDLEEWHR